MQGRLNLVGDPVVPLEAATKQYVDRFTSMGVPTGAYIGSAPPGNTLGPLWWDTNSGQLFIQYNDGSSTQWVSANSIDASQLAGSFLPLTGGTVTGPINLQAPWPKTPRIYQSEIVPAKHLQQARRGYASAASAAGGSRLTFVVAGDSTGTATQNNALAPEDNIFGRIKSYMRRANPGIAFDMVDRSVPGSTWGALADKPTAAWPSWYVDQSKQWIPYYVAPNATTGNVAPDVVFIPMGTNDGPADSSDVGISYFASVFGYFANATMFPVQPDVVLVTYKGAGPAQGGDRAGFQQVASIMRCIHYAGTSILGVTGRTPGLIDLGRYDTMARYGYDPCVQHLEPTLSNVSGINQASYTLPQCDGDFDLKVVWPGQGTTWGASGQSIDFEVSGTIATGTGVALVRLGRNSTIFAGSYQGNANTLNLTPPNVVIGAAGADVIIRVTCRQEQLRVEANGQLLYEGGVMRAGGRFTPKVKITGALFGPMTVSTYSAGVCLKVQQSINDLETWGDGDGIDGNGINHAASWGIAEMETLLLESSNLNLSAEAAPFNGGTVANSTSFVNGVKFTGPAATAVYDLSKHLDLAGGVTGISVTADLSMNLNCLTGAGIGMYAGGSLMGFVAASGANFKMLQVGSVGSGGPTWEAGTGAPTANTKPIGSLYSRTDGAVGSTLYVSRGSGTWAAVAGV
jgi:hypothetical protein